MRRPYQNSKLLATAVLFVASLANLQSAWAAAQILDDVTLSGLFVNGGADTTNPGTTCIKLSLPVHAACNGGYVAIQNNNKQLIAAALQAKATASKIWLYYDEAGGSFHCPALVFTPCSVNSIQLK